MKEQLRKDIGARLLNIRKELGFTQAVMASHFNIGRANYARIEKGEIFPNETVLVTMRKEFDISLDWLVAGVGPKKPMLVTAAKGTAQCGRELEELHYFMDRVPMVKHAILSHFLEYRYKNAELLQELLREGEGEEQKQAVGTGGK